MPLTRSDMDHTLLPANNTISLTRLHVQSNTADTTNVYRAFKDAADKKGNV